MVLHITQLYTYKKLQLFEFYWYAEDFALGVQNNDRSLKNFKRFVNWVLQLLEEFALCVQNNDCSLKNFKRFENWVLQLQHIFTYICICIYLYYMSVHEL